MTVTNTNQVHQCHMVMWHWVHVLLDYQGSINQCTKFEFGVWDNHNSDVIMSILNHPWLDSLLNHLFRRRSKKTSKLRVTGLCAGNSLVSGEFPAQGSSNAESVSIWWCHYGSPESGDVIKGCENDRQKLYPEMKMSSFWQNFHHWLHWKLSIEMINLLLHNRHLIAYEASTCEENCVLTHWTWLMHISVSNLTIIGSDDGLSPGRRQAIIWTNAGCC